MKTRRDPEARSDSTALPKARRLLLSVETAARQRDGSGRSDDLDRVGSLCPGAKEPVDGVSFGDPTLQLRTAHRDAILVDALAAPSLDAHLDSVASVTPFYSELRDDAISSGKDGDPHVRATLDRLRLIPAKGHAILVDAANAQLMELEDGKVVDTMKVIVGKPDFPTPLLAGKIWYVTFNPYWHIPQDVAKRKVAPIVLKRGVAYLKAARYQTVAAFGGDKEEPIDPTSIDWKAVAAGDVEVHIRQLTGPNNMMGKMKFGFVNDYGIFLHDTPHKDLFAKAKRNLSLGCVRVEHPQQLAEWLFGHEPPVPGRRCRAECPDRRRSADLHQLPDGAARRSQDRFCRRRLQTRWGRGHRSFDPGRDRKALTGLTAVEAVTGNAYWRANARALPSEARRNRRDPGVDRPLGGVGRKPGAVRRQMACTRAGAILSLRWTSVGYAVETVDPLDSDRSLPSSAIVVHLN